jgi:hypothetical protein
MPEGVSLHNILHVQKIKLNSIDKLIIAKKIAKAMYQI